MERNTMVAALLSLGLVAVVVALGVIASGCQLEGEAQAGTLDGREVASELAAVSVPNDAADQPGEYAHGKCGHWEDKAAYGESGCGGGCGGGCGAGCGGDDYAEGDQAHAGCPYLKAVHESRASSGCAAAEGESGQRI